MTARERIRAAGGLVIYRRGVSQMKKVICMLLMGVLLMGIALAQAETAIDAGAQSIGLTGVGNARELGGYAAEDGRTVRRGAFLRTAALENATEADIQRLKEDYHLAVVIDLRMTSEVDGAPDPELDGVKYLHLGIMDEEAMAKKRQNVREEDMKGLDLNNTLDRLRLATRLGIVSDRMYVEFLSGAPGKAGYARMFEELLALPEGASLLFHCTQGKDRTGCAAMLILSALGVDEETILADFMLTNTFNAERIEGERQMLAAQGVGADEMEIYMRAMDEVDPQYMVNALEWLKANYGSALGYIQTELGVTDDEIAALRDRYLEAEAAQPSQPVTVPGRPEAEAAQPLHAYALNAAHAVDGRQGIAWEGGSRYVSGSTTLSRYDGDWNLTATATEPFAGFADEVNHIGDIDVYDGEVYAGVEYFMDGEAKNIQIAVYDAGTLELARTYAFDAASGQTEVSGIAVDPDSGSIWLCSWADGESGRYLYRYDLESGAYLGKHHLQPVPQWIQGIAYDDGCLFMTADDGTADLGEPDHVYRCRVDVARTAWPVALERTLDDVTLQGEVEGISFDRDTNHMLVSYNRGAQIVLGMPKGFYQGYDSEIHEIYEYERESR